MSRSRRKPVPVPRVTWSVSAVAVAVVVAAAALLGVSVGERSVDGHGSTAVFRSVAGHTYVALGDSYSAGPKITPVADGVTCLRSRVDYPALLAVTLKPRLFRDVSCSSATSRDFLVPQPGAERGVNPPQYQAITPTTALVTVGIGGNDIGLVQLAESCLSIVPSLLGGKPCAARFTAGGVDQVSRRIQAFAPTYGEIIEHIRSIAPSARIVLVGYPTAIRPGGCYPLEPVLPKDATYLQAKIDELNAVMAAQAKAHGATYVDLRSSTNGHDSCAAPSKRWVEGFVPVHDAAPLHPNAAGMRHTAQVIAAALR